MKSVSHSDWRRKCPTLVAIVAAFGFQFVTHAGPLEWQPGEGHRHAPLPVPAMGKSGFRLLPTQITGIPFTNHLSDAAVANNRILENGSGVALGDVDGDWWCDIFFCRLEGPNVLYRNLGNWRFEDITQSAAVACPGQFSTGAILADVDGDEDLDLLVNSIGGGTRLFLNDGAAHFAEVKDSGLARQFGSTSMAMADIDDSRGLPEILSALARPRGLGLGNASDRHAKSMPAQATARRTVPCRCWGFLRRRRNSKYSGPAAG